MNPYLEQDDAWHDFHKRFIPLVATLLGGQLRPRYIALCESGQVELASSDALEYEAGRNPQPERKAYAFDVLSHAQRFVQLSPEIEARAHGFHQAGLKPLDALHLACAVEAGADYFCTCDDRLLKRARAVHSGPPKVVSPLELDRGDRTMTLRTRPLAEVTQRAIEILCRELGTADTVRFINQFTTGHGDYTTERDVLFAGETLDQIIADIKQTRPRGDTSATADEAQPRSGLPPVP
jgi:hypothetical protein